MILNSPQKIQNFLETLKSHNPKKGDTYHSPSLVLKHKRAHCLEGAIFAAAALRQLGLPPLILDLTATAHDFDHVIAPFKIKNCWGAISKSNHAVLRYRDPVYKSIRELVMSYFHEYTDDNGFKTLRSYSLPINLKQFDHLNWATSKKSLKYIEDYLFQVTHFPIISTTQISKLRRADPIEIKSGRLKIWP